MYDQIDFEEFQQLTKQVQALSLELSVHKALILALMSELPTETMTEFSRFKSVAHSELDKQPLQTDETFLFRKKMNEYLKCAMLESSKMPDL